MSDKKRFHKLDEVGVVGAPEKRSSKEIKEDAIRTAKIIEGMKRKKKSSGLNFSKGRKKTARVN